VSGGESSSLDTGIPHPARVYDYWLGGTDNFAADRETGDQIVATQPSVLPAVRANRAFLRRAVQLLAREAGIRQFLDIGTGLPTNENTHQIAQQVAPESRVVYVDNDRCNSGCSHARRASGHGPHARGGAGSAPRGSRVAGILCSGGPLSEQLPI
jgi:S-adenosyl methyltransferase